MRAAGVLLALIVAIPTMARVSDAQRPISRKSLDVERDPSSLLAKTRLDTARTAADTLVAKRARSVSSECRRQFKEARDSNPDLVSYGCVWKTLRLMTSSMATEYFGGLEVGNALALTFGDDQRTVYTELLSDNLWVAAGLGYWRVGLSAQVAGQTEGEAADGGEGEGNDDTTIDQLFQGGGNAMLHVTLPLAVWINFVGEDSVDLEPVRTFDSFGSFGVGTDIPQLNAAVEKQSGSARVGWQGNFTWRTFNEDFRFFANGSAAYVVGFDGDFYRNLVGRDIARPQGGLGLVGATVGVELGGIARVGLTAGATTLEGANQKPRLSVQLVERK